MKWIFVLLNEFHTIYNKFLHNNWFDFFPKIYVQNNLFLYKLQVEYLKHLYQ